MNGRSPLHVEIAGAGEPIVLVHGTWDRPLAVDHVVVTYDRRGHSRSPWPHPVTRCQGEDDLAELAESLACGPVHLVGNSYGASIARGLAARRPQLIRGVVAHDAPLLRVAANGTPLADERRRLRHLFAQHRAHPEGAPERLELGGQGHVASPPPADRRLLVPHHFARDGTELLEHPQLPAHTSWA